MPNNDISNVTQQDIGELGYAMAGFTESISNADKLLKKGLRDFEQTLSFGTVDLNKQFKKLTHSDIFELEKLLKLDELEKAVGTFQKTINDANTEIAKIDNELSSVADGEKDALNRQKQILERQRALATKQIEVIKKESELIKLETESSKKRKENLKKATDYVIDAVGNLADDLLNVVKSAVTSSVSKLSSAYESSYGTITSYNAYSRADYNQLLDELQHWIKENNLEKVVALSDYQEEIVGILRGGITKDLATTVAKYAVLSKEGGISADFSSESFLKLVQGMADRGENVDAFLSKMMTQSKAVIEEVGNSFGFANNQINVMADSMYQLYDISNMSTAALNNSTASMAALNGVLGKTQLDATKIYTAITDYAAKGIAEAGTLNLLGLRGISGEQLQQRISTEGMEGVLKDSMKAIYQYLGSSTNVEFMNAVNQALGTSLSTNDVLSLRNAYGSYGDFEKAFENAMTAANTSSQQDYFSKLDEYQTATEAFQNSVENSLSDIVQWAKQSVFTEAGLTSIIGSASHLISAKFISNAIKNGIDGKIDGMEGGSSLFSKLSANGNLISKGHQGWSGLSTAGKALSITGLVAGGAMMIGDAISAGIKASNNGMSTGGIIGSGAVGALSGYTGLGMTNEQKMQAVKEGGWLGLDWGSVAKNAGKGALIGGSVGSIANVGVGTLGGAIIGGLVGGAVNFATQWADKHDYQQFLKGSFNTFGESMEKAFNKVNKLGDAVSSFASISEDLESLYNKRDDMAKHRSKYTKQDIALLDAQIAKEEALLAIKQKDLEATESVVDSVEGMIDQFTKYNATISLISSASSQMSLRGWDKDTDFTKLSASEINTAISDEQVKKAIEQGVIRDTGNMLYNKIGILQSIAGSTKGTNYFQKIETADFSQASATGGINSELYRVMTGQQASAEQSFQSAVENSQAMFSRLTDETSYAVVQKIIGSYLENTIGGLVSQGVDRDYAASMAADMFNFDMLPLSKNRIKSYKGWLSNNHTSPYQELVGYYKTGLNYVPYDNFPAILHKGERVQTAQDAALEAANRTSSNQSFSSAMETVITSQTNLIVDILNKIYIRMGGMYSSSRTNLTSDGFYALPSVMA